MLFPILIVCPITYSQAIISAAQETVFLNTLLPCDLWFLFVSFCFHLFSVYSVLHLFIFSGYFDSGWFVVSVK